MRPTLLLLLFPLLLPAIALAATVPADSCSRTDVGTAVTAANAGDTVTIPAGTCSWTTQLTIDKGLHLLGAGEGVTILQDNVIKDTDNPSYVADDRLIHFTVDAPAVWELGHFTIEGVATDPDPQNRGHISASGTSTQFRIHHVTINPLQTAGIRFFGGHMYGLIDNVDFTGNHKQGVVISHAGWDGHSFGDGSWAAPLAWGTDQAIYIEDSTFTNTASQPIGATDCFGGGRQVVRHNAVTNMGFAGSHGTDSSGRERGCRSIEAYANTADYSTNFERAMQCRGGTCTVYNNTVTGDGSPIVNNLVKAVNFRDSQAFPPWGQCDGTGDYDENTAGETGWLCLDQPGAGTSDLLSGDPPTPVAWPNQANDPIYIWGNTVGGSSNNSVGSSTHVQANRDYVNDGTQRPGYVAFTYPHPLQAGFGDPACTHYASPAGGGDGSSFSTPFQVADFWPVASPGDTLCLRDGTYTGANSMIVPTGTVTGTAGNRITIRALNDGKVLLDGEFARNAIRFNDGFDFFTVEGVNACCNTTTGRVVFVNGGDNVTIRRVVAWDSDQDANTHVFGTNVADNTLFEDCAGFGMGRKIFENFTSSNTTFRRLWAQWMGSTHDSPKTGISYNYKATSPPIVENSIATYNRTLETSSETNLYGTMSSESFEAEGGGASSLFGNLGYFLASHGGPAPASLLRATQFNTGTQMTDVVAVTDVSMPTIRFDGTPGGDRELTNATSIGGTGTQLGGDVTVTNLDEGATLQDVSNPYTSATGARLCFRYVDGVLTDTPLWPWPMNQRILDAMTTAGYTPVDVTATVESLLGTIPDACRDDVTEPPPVAATAAFRGTLVGSYP